jgi:N6-adenosine-specific RNA methylase IME4
MPIEEICALRVADLATPDAALFLWSPGSILREAITVMECWGFAFKQQLVWKKDKPALGFWVHNQHENLLIATRGDMRTPEVRPLSIFDAPRREHSRKPDEAYELIECMYPELPKIELFARGDGRPGWATWGNEAGATA